MNGVPEFISDFLQVYFQIDIFNLQVELAGN